MFQNKRDAEALKYVKELNKELNKYGKIFFLVSSADHMNRLISNTELTFEIEINDGTKIKYEFIGILTFSLIQH